MNGGWKSERNCYVKVLGQVMLFPVESRQKNTHKRVKKGTLENNRQKVELFKTEFATLSSDVKELERKVKKCPEEIERLKTLREKLALAKSNLRKTLKKLSE